MNLEQRRSKHSASCFVTKKYVRSVYDGRGKKLTPSQPIRYEGVNYAPTHRLELWTL